MAWPNDWRMSGARSSGRLSRAARGTGSNGHRPDGPLPVGIDGGYLRGRNQEGHCEVVAGKRLLACRREGREEEALSGKCFAFVQTYDEKPKRRRFEGLRSQGLTMNQQVEFLSEGGEHVRPVQLDLSPEAEHRLDWFPSDPAPDGAAADRPRDPGQDRRKRGGIRAAAPALKRRESIKWCLWHGHTFQALHKRESLERDWEAAAYESKDDHPCKRRKGVEERHTYGARNPPFLPN